MPLPASSSPDFSRICTALRESQVSRKFFIATNNKILLAGGALVRRMLGWRADLDDKTRKAIATRAARILAAALAGKPPHDEDAAVSAVLAADLEKLRESLAPLNAGRKAVERGMVRLVRRLPIAGFIDGIRGFGDLALAVIVGEAGDLAAYPSIDKLWKRLGLTPFEGKAYSTWRREGGLTKDDWIASGYSPKRRAEVYACLGEPLFRHQTAASGPYRAIYDERRRRATEAHPDRSKLHAHLDALRVMSKAAIRDLWRHWCNARLRETLCGSPAP